MEIFILGKTPCQHCILAKNSCTRAGVKFEYLNLGENYSDEEVQEIVRQTRGRTFPFVFKENVFDSGKLRTDLKDIYIGGAEQLHHYLKENKG